MEKNSSRWFEQWTFSQIQFQMDLQKIPGTFLKHLTRPHNDL